MKDLVSITPVQAETPNKRQHTDEPPFLLSTADDFPIWVSVALGVVLYVIAGVQVLFISRSIPAWKVIGVETLYLLTLVIFILTRRLPLSRGRALLGLAVVLLLAVGLGCTFAFLLSYVIFEILPLMVVYRFPWRWSLPILGAVAALFVVVIVIPPHFFFHQP